MANVVAPVTPTICSAEHATTHQWTSSCLSSACNKGLLADVLFIKPLSPDLNLCVFPKWGYLSMMKCSTLTLAQENTRKVLSSLHRQSANSSTKLHHSISTLLPKTRTRRKLPTWRAMFPVRVYTVQLLRVLDPQNEDTTILQNICHCLPVRQGLTYSGTLVFILTCALCCILCFDLTGFYAKLETKCLGLNY